ncbi:hypothetical protein CHS0354_018975 [Potamilus streckersoni]|nr:hypothetical protein CHS0354_018975 [Potamilus streckersoni]
MLLKLFIICGLLCQLLNTVCACSCSWGASDERRFCDASFAIRAVVLEEIPQNPDIPEWAKGYPELDPELFIYFYQYKVKVEEVFKKPPSVDIPSTIVVQTPRQQGMCILTLTVGKEVLLTGFGDGNPAWEANGCSWVRSWEEVTTASKDMLRKGINHVDCKAIQRPWWTDHVNENPEF